ncbi:MAG: hypothetical protein PWP15_150 [Methanothermococcus sp.]|jgi:hypothetical protein|nr:hypothetical protein [Methanothermococcus sp.]MDK2988086.1 hypothetical protein [Methanothermococcus sp.]
MINCFFTVLGGLTIFGGGIELIKHHVFKINKNVGKKLVEINEKIKKKTIDILKYLKNNILIKYFPKFCNFDNG